MFIKIALLLVLTPVIAFSQILYGGLVGNVTDASSAAIPGAKVVITHQGTGTTREGTANESGIYSFPTIQPGTYQVNVTSGGFRSYKQTGIEVAANSTTRADVKLDVGDVNESVTVEASAATLQTDRAEVRHEMGKTTLENMPVPVGRNYQMLLGTLPGFSPPRN
ncbi:MAG: carboxypeptidase regulatory-like domain-containing protein, partial [Acidobacteria bacterium]|nr:carboxypeptidase regulatory-like domain-containing protein [Acidobacteriota bacterium]